jgi:hypothetical protein
LSFNSIMGTSYIIPDPVPEVPAAGPEPEPEVPAAVPEPEPEVPEPEVPAAVPEPEPEPEPEVDDEEDVPVSRSAALIEESLNAQYSVSKSI